MQTFSDFERSQAVAEKVKREADLDCVECKKCGSQWFEEVVYQRFARNHNLVLGQEIPPKPGSVKYRFAKCVVCSNVIEPNVMHSTRDLAAGDYDYLLDTLEGKFDKRKREEEVKVEKDASIQSEKL